MPDPVTNVERAVVQAGGTIVAAADGMSNRLRPYLNLAWASFGMFLCWSFFTFVRVSIESERESIQAERASMALSREKSVELSLAQQASLNTTNHNMAGMTNAVEKLIGSIAELRQEIKAVKAANAGLPRPDPVVADKEQQ